MNAYYNRLRLALALVIVLVRCETAITQPQGSNARIDALLSSMTMEEKVGQMTQINLEVVLKKNNGSIVYPIEVDSQKLHEAISKFGVGSFLNNGRMAHSREEWISVISAIQHMASESRIQIPVLYGIDAIHGANYARNATLFPHQLAQAASWNPALVAQIAKTTAYETRSCGIPWVFSPIVDVGRQPLWSQFFETYGEDVYLTTTLGAAAVRGYQSEDLSAATSVAACVKHYVGYSAPQLGKDRTPAYMDERTLREIYLPPFQEAIQQGVRTLIVNSGELNGVPGHANGYLLRNVLREELGFEGIVLSDWGDIERLHTIHRVAHDNREAVAIAIEAGIDMSMVPNDFRFCAALVDLVKKGEVSETRIDSSVRRILQLKYDLGLFDNPLALPLDADLLFGGEPHAKISYQAASESITLLKNEKHILPLSTDMNVLVVGPAGNSLSYLNGPWTRTWQGNDTIIEQEDERTIYQAIQAHSATATYHIGCNEDSVVNRSTMTSDMLKSDVIVLCVGEKPSAEKPGDIHDLTLSAAQLALAEIAIAAGKPVILVLVEGRPRIVSSFVDRCQAVVLAYQPGSMGGAALADVLFGKVNPSGHLPFTYPRYVNDLLTYDHKKSEEVDKNYGSNGYNPQWPFGAGISYTSFDYSDVQLSADTLRADEELEIKVTLSNSGVRSGKDVVQLYVSDEVASITPPVKQLRGFEKVDLEAGAAQTVSFRLSAKDLSFINAQLNSATEAGWFTVEVEHKRRRFYFEP